MVDIWEDDGVELVNIYAMSPDRVEMRALQRTVVRPVAKGIEERSHLYSFFGFLAEKCEKASGDGIVAEVEIFEMDAAAGLPDGCKEVVELLLSGSEQGHGVVMGERHTVMAQSFHQ